jgi:hypothetical protein
MWSRFLAITRNGYNFQGPETDRGAPGALSHPMLRPRDDLVLRGAVELHEVRAESRHPYDQACVGLGIVLRSPQCLRVDHVHLELLPIESHEACEVRAFMFSPMAQL